MIKVTVMCPIDFWVEHDAPDPSVGYRGGYSFAFAQVPETGQCISDHNAASMMYEASKDEILDAADEILRANLAEAEERTAENHIDYGESAL